MAPNTGMSILVPIAFLAACEDGALPPAAAVAPPDHVTIPDREDRAEAALIWTRGGRVLLRRPDPPARKVTGTVD